MALLSATPELGGVWQVRFSRDGRQQHAVAVVVGLSLARGVALSSRRVLSSAELPLRSWLPPIRRALLGAVDDLYARAEVEVARDPTGQLAALIARRCELTGLALEPQSLLAHARRRLEREGEELLAGFGPDPDGLNLLAEIEADARAELLLAEQLGDSYQALVRQGYLDVPSRLFKRRVYRLRRGERIQVLDGGRCTSELCIESTLRIPEADEFLMKLVWLQADEEQLLRHANHFPATRLLL